MPEFNLNDKVRVKLTDLGRSALEADHATFWASVGRAMPYTAPKEDADGWSKWQLWSLMSKLGKYVDLSFQNHLETTIQFEPFNTEPTPTRSLDNDEHKDALLAIEIRLTLQQLEKLVEILWDAQDEGPMGSGWPSQETKELREFFDAALKAQKKA